MVLSKIRTRFWITKARSLIKKVKRQCVICKKLYAFPMVQKMADLPPERCLPFVRPSSVVGVDIFGPFYVRQGRAQVKRYGCVFMCFNIRPIHLEKLNGMDTDTFINAFVRFASRRGYPQKVWCDNRTNLVGARSELKKCLYEFDKDRVIQMARRHEVEWVFNPPHASHHGGMWKRMIRTVRRILVALLNTNSRMTDDVMHTVLCEIENVVNSRPISKVSDDVDDISVLMPNHLLLLEGNASFPWGSFHDANTYRRRWRYVQHIVDQFWKRWTKAYLLELQSRQKWLTGQPNGKVGDIVLICDEAIPRGMWPLGLVEETNIGRDGLVRSVKVRAKNNVFLRPITKLIFFWELWLNNVWEHLCCYDNWVVVVIS